MRFTAKIKMNYISDDCFLISGPHFNHPIFKMPRNLLSIKNRNDVPDLWTQTEGKWALSSQPRLRTLLRHRRNSFRWMENTHKGERCHSINIGARLHARRSKRLCVNINTISSIVKGHTYDPLLAKVHPQFPMVQSVYPSTIRVHCHAYAIHDDE